MGHFVTHLYFPYYNIEVKKGQGREKGEKREYVKKITHYLVGE